jgi:syntaxin-binding protein 5
MLSFKHADARDLSGELIDVREWQIKDFRRLDTLLDASAFAYDPTSGLLAIGTDSGAIRILGGPAVDVKLENGSAVKSLHFAASSFRLVCTGASLGFARLVARSDCSHRCI